MPTPLTDRMSTGIVGLDEVLHGGFVATEENLSYLADSIVFLRHLELDGELRKAIGVLKKRTGDFERSLREYGITAHASPSANR